MVIFHSYVTVYQRVIQFCHCNPIYLPGNIASWQLLLQVAVWNQQLEVAVRPSSASLFETRIAPQVNTVMAIYQL